MPGRGARRHRLEEHHQGGEFSDIAERLHALSVTDHSGILVRLRELYTDTIKFSTLLFQAALSNQDAESVRRLDEYTKFIGQLQIVIELMGDKDQSLVIPFRMLARHAAVRKKFGFEQ